VRCQRVFRSLPVFTLVERNDAAVNELVPPRNAAGTAMLLSAMKRCNCQKYQSTAFRQTNDEERLPVFRASVARAIVCKLTTRGHGPQRVPAAHDALVQVIVLQRVGRNVGHVGARSDVLVG
jgi:hypothetical protein